MEAILGLILIITLLVGRLCAFFLAFVQPIWRIVDVAVSKVHSGGTKAAVILLSLLLLGPIMTFFYACFGTRSRILRNSTLVSFVVLVVSVGAMMVLAVALPMVKEKLPWRSRSSETNNTVWVVPSTITCPSAICGKHRA